MSLRIGELFAGYCGLGMGVRAVIGGEIAWVSDVCKHNDDGTVGHHTPCRAPCSILAHRYPGVPNHGDITAIDWATVEPVAVLTGGFPCPDVSTAGARAGLRPGTRSGLWAYMAHAIQQLQPRLVVIENVRGLYSAPAHSDVEPCPWCVGDDPDRHMRALGAVLADLADIGYDAAWCGLRAADVGAPHGRFRVFIAAYPSGDPWRIEHRNGGATADARSEHVEQRRQPAPGQTEEGRALGEPTRCSGALLPTPTSRDHKGANQRGDNTCLAGALLPTPAASRYGSNQSLSEGAAADADRLGHERGGPARDRWPGPADGGCGAPLTLLPTPSVADSMGGHERRGGDRGDELLLKGIAKAEQWGEYAPAIARWESLTRPAPAPTELGLKGSPRLSPRFSEWMMGLPAGWVTDVPGITRNEALKAIGNGVVPQQAEAAVRWLLHQIQTHALDGAA